MSSSRRCKQVKVTPESIQRSRVLYDPEALAPCAMHDCMLAACIGSMHLHAKAASVQAVVPRSMQFPCAARSVPRLCSMQAHLVQPLRMTNLGWSHLQIQHSLCHMISATPQLTIVHYGVGKQHDVSSHSVLCSQCHHRLHHMKLLHWWHL